MFDSNNATATISSGPNLSGLTCSATRVGSVDVSKVQLSVFPMGDGKVRSIVSAQAGWITPLGGTSTAGVTLVARDASGNFLGSGPLLANGTVGPFTLSSTITQASLAVVDAVGNTTAITGYPESVELSFVGKTVSGSQNALKACDATTGGFGHFAPANWQGKEVNIGTYSALGSYDQVFGGASPAPKVTSPVAMGWAPTTPVNGGITPRSGAASALGTSFGAILNGNVYNQLFDYIYGGCRSGLPADANPGAVYRLGVGLSSSTTQFAGTATAMSTVGPTPTTLGPNGAAMVTDGQTAWVLGGQGCASAVNTGNNGIWSLSLPTQASAIATWADTGDSLAGHTIINATSGWGTSANFGYCPVSGFCGPALLAYNPTNPSCSIYFPAAAIANRWMDCTSNVPAGRVSPLITYDPGLTTGQPTWYLYGGLVSGLPQYDTWKGTYNASGAKFTWAPLSTTNNPGAGRESGFLTYDADLGRVTLVAAAYSSAAGKSTLNGEIWQLVTDASGCSGLGPPCWLQVTDNTPGILKPQSRAGGAQSNVANARGASFASGGPLSVLFGGNNGTTDLADAWAISNYSQSRLLLTGPTGITNPGAVQGMTLRLESEGNGFSATGMAWGGTGWDYIGGSINTNSGNAILGTISGNNYVQPDGTFAVLLEDQTWGYVSGPGGTAAADYLRVVLNFK